MRNIITTIVLFLLGTACFAQDKVSAAPSQLDTTSVLLLQRISQHTAPCYRLYKTENMWTFLELETFSGRIWQVQYGINDKGSRTKSGLNYHSLVPADDQQGEYAGRFELFPTQNMYNFILLDTADGRTWQVQWSIEYLNRMVLEIE